MARVWRMRFQIGLSDATSACLVRASFNGVVKGILELSNAVIHNVWETEQTRSLQAVLPQRLQKAIQIHVQITCVNGRDLS